MIWMIRLVNRYETSVSQMITDIFRLS